MECAGQAGLALLGFRSLQGRDLAGILVALHAAPGLFELAAVCLAHSVTMRWALVGSRPSVNRRSSILTTTSWSPYWAWKWGGRWSLKYIRMTMP